jgi:hypothetical protein
MGWDSPLGLVVAAAKGRRNPSASPNPNGLQLRQGCSPSHYNTHSNRLNQKNFNLIALNQFAWALPVKKWDGDRNLLWKVTILVLLIKII